MAADYRGRLRVMCIDCEIRAKPGLGLDSSTGLSLESANALPESAMRAATSPEVCKSQCPPGRYPRTTRTRQSRPVGPAAAFEQPTWQVDMQENLKSAIFCASRGPICPATRDTGQFEGGFDAAKER